jgi:LPXTG-motif cell wall-anchored protein
MTDLAARMVAMTGSQGPVTIQTAQAMDLNATGNGRVSFAVGSAFAGKVAVIGHYHDGVLYFQQRWVKADGTVDPYFSGFSPVIIMVTNQTQPLADIPTSEPGATPLSAKSSSSTAPKTGESSANTIIFIIGMVALGAAIATYRKKSY